MSKPLVSIIIPVYKIPNYIDRCVKSVINQTYTNLEIILVDDGSPDGCPALCDAWIKRDHRIMVIHKENGGLSEARNFGLEAASGEYVSFIDGDDWIENQFIETLVDNSLEYNCDISGVKYRKRFDSDGMTETESCSEAICYSQEQAMHHLITNSIQQVVWNKLYKKELIKDVPFAVGKYHEDEFWSYQIFAKAQKYVEDSYIGYDYYQRSDSIMGESYSVKRLDAIEAKVQRQDFLITQMPELEEIARMNLLFACFYHGQLALKQLNGSDKNTVVMYLQNIYSRYSILPRWKHNLKQSHRIWLFLGRISFVNTCRLRNLLKIGI